MADISKITLPSGTTYDIKDTVARNMATGAIKLKGVTTTALTDEATTNPITINNLSYTAVNQDAVFYGKKEFVFDGTKWHEFGDMSGLGSLATKNSVSATYTPAGTVSQPTFTGTTKYLHNTFTGTKIYAHHTFSGTAKYLGVSASTSSKTLSGNFTPSGTVAVSYNDTQSGNNGQYTPAGTVSTPTITVTPSTTSKYVASSSSGGGSVTAGTKASCTFPAFTASVSNETLTLGWTAGSFTQNTPTAVTLPTFSSQTIATGISSATSTQPTFTGTTKYLHNTFTGSQGSVSVSGTLVDGVSIASYSSTATGRVDVTPAGSVSTTYNGTSTSANGNFTPEGTVAVSFNDTSSGNNGQYTPAGTVSQPTFTGTQATITSN